MSENNRYLLGRGELLWSETYPPGRKGKKKPDPYLLHRAKERLIPKIESCIQHLNDLSDEYKPTGLGDVVIRIHPSFISASKFPGEFIRSANLKFLGTRACSVCPESPMNPAQKAGAVPSVDIIASGTIENLNNLRTSIFTSEGNDSIGKNIGRIEDIFPFTSEQRLFNLSEFGGKIPIEFGIHKSQGFGDVYPLLVDFLSSREVLIDWNQFIEIQGINFYYGWFDKSSIDDLAKFAWVRVIRRAPTLRMIKVTTQPIADLFASSKMDLPESSIDKSEQSISRVAVFDGGVSSDFFEPWVTEIVDQNSSAPNDDCLKHGFQVTSALLFGNIPNSKQLDCPRFAIDHYRVLDGRTGDEDPYLLPKTLKIIVDALKSGNYEFANVSVGPEYPLDDDEIHPWTAIFDQISEKGGTLISIAAGNTGDLDEELGYNRIQVPADGVNVLSVGSASRHDTFDTEKAWYSSVGPGRPTGYVKPDIIAFGGTSEGGFRVFHPNGTGQIQEVCGTSFSAPSVLRAAIQMRELFRNKISILGIKCLLINNADNAPGSRNLKEKGWGTLLPDNVENLLLCGDGEVRVIYQGGLTDGQYVRSPIPSPVYEDLFEELSDDHPVEVAVTLCIASETDPFDMAHYTRRGLEAWFTHKILDENGVLKDHTRPFFQVSTIFGSSAGNEHERRASGKWETVLHQRKSLQLSHLRDAAIRLHPMSRIMGERDHSEKGSSIPYAMVVSVKIPEIIDLYDRTYRKFGSKLEIMTPIRIQI